MDLTWPMTILPYSGGHQNWPIIGSHLHSFYGHQPAKSIYIYILFFRNVEGDHSSRSQYTMNYELSAADRERYSSWNGRDTRDGPQSVLHRGGFFVICLTQSEMSCHLPLSSMLNSNWTHCHVDRTKFTCNSVSKSEHVSVNTSGVQKAVHW